jgi:hypothetical protein
MTLPERRTHVFLVRIWCEPREIEGARPRWRGWIEHTATTQRRYLTSLDGIAAFIWPYLERMGVPVEQQGLVQKWLDRWRRLLRG